MTDSYREWIFGWLVFGFCNEWRTKGTKTLLLAGCGFDDGVFGIGGAFLGFVLNIGLSRRKPGPEIWVPKESMGREHGE